MTVFLTHKPHNQYWVIKSKHGVQKSFFQYPRAASLLTLEICVFFPPRNYNIFVEKVSDNFLV